MKSNGIHPVDAILAVVEKFQSSHGKIADLYDGFVGDHNLEEFSSLDDLQEYWSQKTHFERLKSGTYGKLNYLYSFKILLDCRSELDALLVEVADQFANQLEGANSLAQECREAIRFQRELAVSFNDDLSLQTNKIRKFNFNFIDWRNSGYKTRLENTFGGSSNEVEFCLHSEQIKLLQTQMNLFSGTNKNAMLRQMAVDTSPDQFFYTAETPAV